MDVSTSSKKTILDLPETALRPFFDNLSLIELMHTDEVTRDWKKLKTSALLRRKELIIVRSGIDFKWFEVPYYNHLSLTQVKNEDGSPFVKPRVRLDLHALYADQMKPKMVDNIIQLMPNLTKIRIQLKGGLRELWKIKHLLDIYRNQLIEVTVYFAGLSDENLEEEDLETTSNDFRDMFISLITTLNRMTALNSLDLILRMPADLNSQIEVNLSVARRLKKLKVSTRGFTNGLDEINIMEHTFKAFAEENENLQELGGSNVIRLDTFLSFGPRVLNALQELYIDGWIGRAQIDAFERLVQQCPKMEVLWLSIAGVSVAELAEKLVFCKTLVCLELRLCFDAQLGNVTLGNHLTLDQLPVIPSVKMLKLIITTASHLNFEQMDLDWIFPNVQVVILQHTFWRCLDCDFKVPRDIAYQLESAQIAYSLLVHECQRLARAQFSEFSRLITLKADIGLKPIILSFKEKVSFTHNALSEETFNADVTFYSIDEYR